VCFIPGEKGSDGHWLGGWVGPQRQLEVMMKRTEVQFVSHTSCRLIAVYD
jgi:hypothetical protein